MKLIRSLYVSYLCGRNLENRLPKRHQGSNPCVSARQPLKLLRFEGFFFAENAVRIYAFLAFFLQEMTRQYHQIFNAFPNTAADVSLDLYSE